MSDPATETFWTTKGNMDDLLEAFKEFPDWCKRLFRHAPELGLWQLRDLVRAVPVSFLRCTDHVSRILSVHGQEERSF